jgi:hypothetical protein
MDKAGRGLSALQTFLMFYETQQKLYPKVQEYALLDDSDISGFDAQKKAKKEGKEPIPSIYSKLGFQKRQGAEFFLDRPRYLVLGQDPENNPKIKM